MIAHYMKRHTAVTNGWLTQRLKMGITNGVSRYIRLFEDEGKHKQRVYKRMIARITP